MLNKFEICNARPSLTSDSCPTLEVVYFFTEMIFHNAQQRFTRRLRNLPLYLNVFRERRSVCAPALTYKTKILDKV